MKIIYLLLTLAMSFGLCADSEILKQALAEHMLPYRASKQLDLHRLSNSVLACKGKCAQIKVIPQSTGITGLEGVLQGSSCGYHAVKNGVLCALALLNNGEQQEYLDMLQSDDYGHFLFGMPYAPWRLEVMKDRFKGLAKSVYRRYLMKDLKNDGSSDALLIRRCINDIEPIDPEFTGQGFRYTADKPLIYAQLRQRMEALIKLGSMHTEQLHSLIDRIDQFFTDSKVDFTISLEGHCYSSVNPSVLELASGDQYGKWVTSAEISKLVESQKISGLLQTYPGLLVATYGEDLGGCDHHSFVSEGLVKLYALATESSDDLIGVVLVYLSNSTPTHKQSVYARAKNWLGFGSFSEHAQEIQKIQDNGHWVAFVVSRINKEMCYYVLDSINSATVVCHQRIQELVDFFEGKKELPGYQWTASQWTVNQSNQPIISSPEPDKKPLVSHNIKLLLGSIGLSCLTWGAWYLIR